jgi:predicted transcriptional regulator of viral defense system
MTRELYPETSIRPRVRLAAVLQTAKDLVSIDDAVAALGVNRTQAAKLLARWQRQGWLKRVGRGLYAPIPLDAMSTEQVLTDPWVLVPARFESVVYRRLDSGRTLAFDRAAVPQRFCLHRPPDSNP